MFRRYRETAWAGVAFVVSLAILVCGLLGYYLQTKYEEVIAAKSKKLERVVNSLELRLSGSLMAVKLLAGDIALNDKNIDHIRPKLQNAAINLGLRNAVLYDRNGRFLVDAAGNQQPQIFDQDSFDQALNGHAVVSNRIVPGTLSGMYVSLRVPVYNGFNQVEAVLAASIPASEISSLIAREELAEGQYIFVMDANGQFLYHPRLAELYPEGDRFFVHLFPMSSAQPTVITRPSIVDQIDKVFVYHQLKHTMWRVTYAAPLRAVYWETLRAAIPNVFVVCLLITIIALIYRYIQITHSNRQVMDTLKLERLSAATEMAAGIAHEVRNPLTSIKGFIQLMRRQEDKSNFRPYLDIILGEIERIDALIGEFQTLARPLRQPHPVKADLSKVVADVVLLMEAQAQQKNVTLEYVAQGEMFDAAGIWVKADVPQIKQVLINLIKNALDASAPGGRIWIHISLQQERPSVTITDNGCGIEPEVIHKLGTPFFTTKEGGSGLGLSICYTIIHNHGGQITVKSKPGEGTAFTVMLPALSTSV